MMHPWDTIRARYMEREPGSIDLVANVRRLPAAQYRLHADIVLRRATEEEIEHFRTIFRNSTALSRAYRNPFETHTQHNAPDSGLLQITFPPLLPSEFRYHVIECAHWDRQLWLRQASALSSFELKLGPGWHFGVANGMDHFGLTPVPLDFEPFIMDVNGDDDVMVDLDESALQELGAAYGGLLAHDESIVPLRAITEEYMAQRRVAHGNMTFLGVFALLERLLTRTPVKDEPETSITRQLVRRTATLDGKLRPPLTYAEYFPSLKRDQVWDRLQALRSSIAHGYQPTFTGRHKRLRDLGNAQSFVRAALKRVMACALREPELLRDLRAS